MTFDKRYTFADDESARDFESKRCAPNRPHPLIHSDETATTVRTRRLAFLNRHKNRDVRYTCTEHFDIPGMQENMLACEDEAAKPWWLNTVSWFFATLLCCGVCFRKLYASVTMESNYTYIKRIYAHACPPGPVASHVSVVCPNAKTESALRSHGRRSDC